MYNAQKAFFIIEEILLTCQKSIHHVRCVIGLKILQIAPLSRSEVRHLDFKKREKNLESREFETSHSVAIIIATTFEITILRAEV